MVRDDVLAPGRSRRDLVQQEPLVQLEPLAQQEPLAVLAHLSDLHVCDAQSPARAEVLDRWSDPDSPIRDAITEVGTYRPQEMLTTQVVDAAVRAVNGAVGPLTGAPPDLAVVTGDNTDNAQANELGWYLALLEGGWVHPDSGNPRRWEGVGGPAPDDERFWHPGCPGFDVLQRKHGFPAVPGLLDAARAGFAAGGLDVPWLAVHGNHDRLLQGTLPAVGALAGVATGDRAPTVLPAWWPTEAVVGFLTGLATCDHGAVRLLASLLRPRGTADRARRVLARGEFVAAHFTDRARPAGHGFARPDGPAHYRHDVGDVSLLVLDTVNEHGGWQGSLDRQQLAWLDAELTELDEARRYAVLASHHPLRTLVNRRVPPGESRRVLGGELAAVLRRHPSVVLWLNGHTHRTKVVAHGRWWEVTTPSLVDWPQQGRLVELVRVGQGSLAIATTMLDHAAPLSWSTPLTPAQLAALSRELAANAHRAGAGAPERSSRRGSAGDRNAVLLLPDPWARPAPAAAGQPVGAVTGREAR